MRALAEFIMRGRLQAAVVAVLASGLPLVSPAAVALVTLRRGLRDGAQILLWALLPIAVFLALGHLGTLVALGGLLVVFAAALLLRSTSSWPQTLVALVALSVLASLLFAMAVPEMLQNMVQVLNEAFAQVREQAAADVKTQRFSQTFVLGSVAYVVLANGLLGLVLARWWQAVLYNPGGFQAEFHQIRLGPLPAVLCLVATLYCLQQGADYLAWIIVLSMPLLVVGIAIVHRSVKALRLGRHWLVLFYVAVILFSPLSILILTIVAFIDIWVDFRGRLKPRG